MALHVDIIKGEPLAGTEQVLARVVLDDGHVTIESPDDEYWRDALARAVRVDPDDDPETFVNLLSERVDGTYVFATGPHDDSDCAHASDPVARESAHV